MARAGTAMKRLGIKHLEDRAVARMSSGEAKRTLIAWALAREPRALLFDEPGNALDLAVQFQLRDTLPELARSGLAILLVTHHVSAPCFGDHLGNRAGGAVAPGRILADGAKDKVLTEGNLSELFGVRVRLERNDGYFQAL
jgi:iron complex transport system ATP-binding protein